MDSEFLAFLSWREVLVAVVVLLVLYILFAFLRMNRLREEKQRAHELPPGVARSAVEAYAAVQEPETATRGAVPGVVEPARPKEEAAFAWNEPPQDDAESRRIEALEQDVAQLRREIGGLRAEVQSIREEQRRELTKVQVTQNASPFYSDAMQLAVQGREAADISALCGISRAEAELVVALARNRDQPLG